MSITNRISELLHEQGKTQADICNYIGIKPNVFTTWKTRGTDPPAKLLVQICDFFNISLEYLLTGTETKRSPVPETKTEQVISETSKELLEVFESLPMKGRVKLLNIVYDFEEQYSNGTAGKSQPTELPPLNNPLVSENEQKLLEVFQNFTEMEQVKIIGRIEEWLETKRRRESENNQPPQPQITIDPQKPWRLTARTVDGTYESRFATPEEIEKLKALLEGNPEEPDY